jgi:hypothetical protein
MVTPRHWPRRWPRTRLLSKGRRHQLGGVIEKVRSLRDALVAGGRPDLAPLKQPAIAFDLPWPWGGERFTLTDIRPLTWITGPLGSGKTRLARALAAALPGGVFLGLDRPAGARPDVARALAWLARTAPRPPTRWSHCFAG